MKRSFPSHLPARRRSIAIAACTCALVLLAGSASTALALDQDVDLAGAGMTELGDPDAVQTPVAPSTDPAAAATGSELASGPVDQVAPTSTLTNAELSELTKPQLRALIVRTRTRWLQLQTELGSFERARDAAEAEVDAALSAYGARLLELFDDKDSAELLVLRTIRSESDPVVRADLRKQLRPEDQALVAKYDAAVAAAALATSTADAKRSAVAVVAADLQFARDFQSGLEPQNESAEPAFNTKHVFATGPIPSIGYFGAASGDGMLGGWMGLAGAALGGVGCSPPDATVAASGVKESGQASWYGPGFHGQNTANGETYDQEAMTAAHKSLPFGTVVKVYSSTTGRCAFVRINDRGPYIEGRIIDLSHAAATAIGMEGTASVEIEIWAQPGTLVAPITEPTPDQWPAEARARPAALDTPAP